MIAPHREKRKKIQPKDGRQSRRYCKRWRIEGYLPRFITSDGV